MADPPRFAITPSTMRRSSFAFAVLTSLTATACAMSSDVGAGGESAASNAAALPVSGDITFEPGSGIDIPTKGGTPISIAPASPLIAWPTFTAPNPTDGDSIRIRKILLNTNKYSLTQWYHARGYDSQTGTYLTLGDGFLGTGIDWGDGSENGEQRVR